MGITPKHSERPTRTTAAPSAAYWPNQYGRYPHLAALRDCGGHAFRCGQASKGPPSRDHPGNWPDSYPAHDITLVRPAKNLLNPLI